MADMNDFHATLDDLYRVPGKAELVGGRIVHLMPTGRKPNRIAGRIYRSLDEYAEKLGQGEAYTDNIDYTVPPLQSGRESFSPDASYYVGPYPANPMRFIEGPPTFAVEVRSENDYGSDAEMHLAAKRADYFEAGTLVVWDVDPIAECIRIHRAADPRTPVVVTRGQSADAEPAVPGWRVAVDWVLGS
jgi:Uma2 family endonuclease